MPTEKYPNITHMPTLTNLIILCMLVVVWGVPFLVKIENIKPGKLGSCQCHVMLIHCGFLVFVALP